LGLTYPEARTGHNVKDKVPVIAESIVKTVQTTLSRMNFSRHVKHVTILSSMLTASCCLVVGLGLGLGLDLLSVWLVVTQRTSTTCRCHCDSHNLEMSVELCSNAVSKK